MILLTRAIQAFLADPVGSVARMREDVPSFPVAASALFAAALTFAIFNFLLGLWAFPHTFQEGGKREHGPVIFAMVEVVRIFGVSAGLWFGISAVLKEVVSGAEVMWLTLPYALASIVVTFIELGAVALFRVTSLDFYSPAFFIGFCGSLLVLLLGIRALLPKRDWLGCLPLGAVAWYTGVFLPFLVLPVAGIYAVMRSKDV
jgi:hypothetical protein